MYRSLKEVLEAMKNGGDYFEAFETEAEAAAFYRPRDAKVARMLTEDMYVVWTGKFTGVMDTMEWVKATAAVAGAEADRPMSKERYGFRKKSVRSRGQRSSSMPSTL